VTSNELRPVQACRDAKGAETLQDRKIARTRSRPAATPPPREFPFLFGASSSVLARNHEPSSSTRAGTSPFVLIARGVPHHVGGERVIGRGAGNSRKHQFLIAASA